MTHTRTTDAKGRVSLPKAFINSTIIIEELSDTELRIRKARIVPEDEVRFAEEHRAPLSDSDRDLFLKLLSKPPAATPVLKKAIRKYGRKNG